MLERLTDATNLLVVISTDPSATEVQRVKGFGRAVSSESSAAFGRSAENSKPPKVKRPQFVSWGAFEIEDG